MPYGAIFSEHSDLLQLFVLVPNFLNEVICQKTFVCLAESMRFKSFWHGIPTCKVK